MFVWLEMVCIAISIEFSFWMQRSAFPSRPNESMDDDDDGDASTFCNRTVLLLLVFALFANQQPHMYINVYDRISPFIDIQFQWKWFCNTLLMHNGSRGCGQNQNERHSKEVAS